MKHSYIVDLKRRSIQEKKDPIAGEVQHCQTMPWLGSLKMEYYTYQLRSAQGRAVINGIEANVDLVIFGNLNLQVFAVKPVYNVAKSSKCQNAAKRLI